MFLYHFGMCKYRGLNLLYLVGQSRAVSDQFLLAKFLYPPHHLGLAHAARVEVRSVNCKIFSSICLKSLQEKQKGDVHASDFYFLDTYMLTNFSFLFFVCIYLIDAL